MQIIRKMPAENGAYPPLQDWSGLIAPAGYYRWPDGLDTQVFQNYNGFVVLTVVRGVVQSYQPDVEAWEAWKATLPPEPEPEPGGNLEARVTNLETAISDGLNLYKGDLGNG